MSDLIIKDLLKQKNPFHIPSNEEVFSFRREERRKKLEHRKSEFEKPLHERGMKRNFSIKKRPIDSKDLQKTAMYHPSVNLLDDEQISKISKRKVKKKKRSKSEMERRKKIIDDVKKKVNKKIEKPRHFQKEKMNNYIMKKRQMFLLQLAIDTKKKEMTKIRKMMKKREKELKREEDKLKKDQIAFEDFLTEKDMKVIQEKNLSEAEMKKKNIKQNKIKHLQVNLNSLHTAISQLSTRLACCLKYKEFLDGLVNNNHFASNVTDPVSSKEDEEEEDGERNKDAESGDEEEDEEEEGEGELRMFFVDPDQLLSLFTKIEKKNLDLITGSQQIEETIESVKKNMKKFREEKILHIKDLRNQLTSINETTEVENEKLINLKCKKGKKTVHVKIEGELMRLKKEILRIFKHVEENSQIPENELEHLYMLTNIELTFNKFMESVRECEDSSLVVKIEKDIEKERRQRIREKKNVEILERKNRKRKTTKKVVVKKKKIKKLMRRSEPVDNSRKKYRKSASNKRIEKKMDGFDELFGL